MQISELFIYPIKSCRGISLSMVDLDPKGFKHDRRFMVVDADGQMLTQRQHPKMALIDCAIEGDKLQIGSQGVSNFTVPLSPWQGGVARVQVWSDVCKAIEVSLEANEWFSHFLGFDARLVYMPDHTKRVVDTRYNTSKATTTFTDGFPILMISQESLDDLNQRLDLPLSIHRFRPNLVVTGFKPYQEDEIGKFSIGHLDFEVKKPCARCVITTIDPITALKGAEPLKTLATYRKRNNKIYFGQNVIHLNHDSSISVGDKITW